MYFLICSKINFSYKNIEDKLCFYEGAVILVSSSIHLKDRHHINLTALNFRNHVLRHFLEKNIKCTEKYIHNFFTEKFNIIFKICVTVG